jgi:hypothetical protein
MQELDQLFKEYLDFYFTQVNTSFPGVVTEYDAETRRATIQPSLKRRTGNKEFVEFPLLIDVPVQYPGTKKFTIHFPLEKGDEVAVFFSQRSLEAWKATGMDAIEDPDPRRFSLPDAYCTPGLQPVEFISATSEKALEVIHKTTWDGDIIDHFIMDEDQVDFVRLEKTKDSYHYHLDKDTIETTFKKDDKQIAKSTITDAKIETLYKDVSSSVMKDSDIKVMFKKKSQVLMEDDHIQAKTEKCTLDIAGDVMSMDNGKNKFELKGSVSLVSTGSDLVEIGNTVDTLGGILSL